MKIVIERSWEWLWYKLSLPITFVPKVFHVVSTPLRLLTVVRIEKPRENRYNSGETPVRICLVVSVHNTQQRRACAMDESQQEVIAQTTVTLPFLNDEVPALYLADGRPYIPVCAVCRALGIRTDTHIRRWRTLVLWITARKLPFQTKKRGKRLVWCLLISEVPFLYSLFDWQLVSPERRLQLRRATEEQVKLADLAYQEMQQRYKAMRQSLFTFLTTFADIDTLLQQYADILSPRLDDESALVLSTLVDRGRSLFQKATAHARKMLHDQGTLPIIDTFKIDAYNKVIDTFSIPLLPITPAEHRNLSFAWMAPLTAWRQELQAFWSKRG